MPRPLRVMAARTVATWEAKTEASQVGGMSSAWVAARMRPIPEVALGQVLRWLGDRTRQGKARRAGFAIGNTQRHQDIVTDDQRLELVGT